MTRCDFRIEPHNFQQLLNSLANTLGRPVVDAGNQPDVSFNREMREQPDLLDDVADHASKADDIPAAHGLAFD